MPTALVAQRRGKLHALVTQNIDELHQRAGQSPALVVEVHGSMRRVMCWQCGRRAPMEDALARVRAGEADPHCRDCGGILKSDTISFGQSLVPEVIDRALNAAAEADLLLAIGTTLQVQPVASMVPIAPGPAAVVIVNQPTMGAGRRGRARADRRRPDRDLRRRDKLKSPQARHLPKTGPRE
jgi:NAD-dependent deacetylase